MYRCNKRARALCTTEIPLSRASVDIHNSKFINARRAVRRLVFIYRIRLRQREGERKIKRERERASSGSRTPAFYKPPGQNENREDLTLAFQYRAATGYVTRDFRQLLRRQRLSVRRMLRGRLRKLIRIVLSRPLLRTPGT